MRNCSCGHSDAAHAGKPGPTCAFCSCAEFASEQNDFSALPVIDVAGSAEVQQALSGLLRHPAFRDVEADHLHGLARRGQRRLILSGTVLMDRGEDSDRLYLLLQGQVSVERPAGGLVPALEATLGPGDIVGEVGLLHGALHSAKVTALDDLRVLELKQSDVRAVLREHQDMRLAFLRMIHHRLNPEQEGPSLVS